METIHVVNVSTDQVPHGSRIVVRVDNADDDDDHPRGLIRGADGIPVARVITRAVYAGQPATHGRLRIPTKSITHSDRNRSPVPTETDHLSERATRDLES